MMKKTQMMKCMNAFDDCLHEMYDILKVIDEVMTPIVADGVRDTDAEYLGMAAGNMWSALTDAESASRLFADALSKSILIKD